MLNPSVLNELKIAATSILTSIEQIYLEEGIDLPDRRYISLGGRGSVAYDCTQLTVSWEQTYSGLPGNPIQVLSNCTSPRSGVFVVELVRPIPVSQRADTPPESELMNESADQLMQDAALLYQGGMLACEASEFGKGLVDISADPPAGTLQALIMNVIMVV